FLTANPATVEHILKTKFNNYQKGESGRAILFDLLGDGIFNADGASWKFQRQVSSHEFNADADGHKGSGERRRFSERNEGESRDTNHIPFVCDGAVRAGLGTRVGGIPVGEVAEEGGGVVGGSGVVGGGGVASGGGGRRARRQEL
ncbi:Cytochrome P450 94A1, partial [Linum perenne]